MYLGYWLWGWHRTISFLISGSVPGPTLDGVTSILCPQNEPYKCLPYGKCYGYDKYCDPESRTAESCFSHNDNISQLNWCREVKGNISLLRHPSCRFACESKFKFDLNPVSDTSDICFSSSTLGIMLFCLAVVGSLMVGVIGTFLVYRRRSKVQKDEGCKLQTHRADIDMATERQQRQQNESMSGNHQPPSAAVDLADINDNNNNLPQPDPESQENQPLLGGDDLSVIVRNSQQSENDAGDEQMPCDIHHPAGTDSSTPSSVETSTTLGANGTIPSVRFSHHNDNREHGQPFAYIHTATGHCNINNQRQHGSDLRCITNATSPDEGGVAVVTSQSHYEPE